ncbi:hypothetical protein F5Y01DRAFT_310635 [Xylaria sp. FL0043]|nr:hypothetical protein F5Y01DRAFT_310635 [Xylaria sp. FL0043]
MAAQKEPHMLSTRAHTPTLLMSKRPRTPPMTPTIRIDPPEREHRNSPISVSKRREVFENAQGHSDMATAANAASSGNTHSQQSQQHMEMPATQGGLSSRHEEEHATPLSQHASPRQPNAFTSTNQQSEHEELEHREGQSFNEQAFEPEIAKPTPIAPPNHECSWKERYLDLTAEIRQLKAELSTRASLKSSDILGHGYAQREDDLDLLEVTIILHFRDRDDIVINTDVVRYAEPSSS